MAALRTRFFSCLLASLILLTNGALGNDRIIFAGSTTVKPVVEQGVAMFRKLHPQVDAARPSVRCETQE